VVSGDLAYLAEMIKRNLVRGRVLEIGSFNRQGIVEGNAQSTCVAAGLDWTGTDIESGPGVSFVLDIFDEHEIERRESSWDVVLLFNILEHVYDPISALRNALRLVGPSGCCVVCAPAVWELHDFPADYWRPLPDFYREFARREGITVPDAAMRWIVGDRLLPVETLADGKQKLLPSKRTGDHVWSSRRNTWSRIVHRVAHTTGRDMFFPYSGLGVVITKTPPQSRKLS